MTRSATEFITPLTMQALSRHPVHLDLLNPDTESVMGHIELARWADLILIAPASANFLARFASGHGDDLLTTVCLAAECPVAIAPAMNQAMWSKPATQDNQSILVHRGVHLLGPDSGLQACGEIGAGRLLDIDPLIERVSALFDTGKLQGRTVLITAGPTREAIDPVRFISNHSSGKMAYALAAEAAAEGAKVTLVSGPVQLSTPESVERIDVESAEEMYAAVMAAVASADVFIGVAAVADYRPTAVANEKIKKTEAEMVIKLVKNPDIISSVSEHSARPFVAGFAAETENVVANGQEKLERKGLDLLFANHATDTFNSDSVAVTALTKDGQQELGPGNKHTVARAMLSLIAEQLKAISKGHAG